MLKTILVTGGAGYIGSHMIKLLHEKNYRVVTFDNLSTGYRNAITDGDFVFGDLQDKQALNKLFTEYRFDAVMHFAGVISVGESMKDPAKYYDNNVTGTLNLLNAMRNHHVKRIIFSSTAAIFGEPKTDMISESHQKLPINPYGWSKFIIENALRDFYNAYGIKYGILRYFNASGADVSATLGERHYPETHLIPLAIFAALSKNHTLTIFGNDYPTNDGTCIRDYIHICDLCEAHLLVLNELMNNAECLEYNLGNGKGYSVLDVIKAVELISEKPVKKQFSNRRAGDPSQLIADSTAIRKSLGWQPQYEVLETIVSHALAWETSSKRYLQ